MNVAKNSPTNNVSATLLSHAKINLFLEVVKKRDDGFHEIILVNSLISLADSLTFTPREDDKIFLRVTGNATSDIPHDEKNLVVRALKKLQEFASQNNCLQELSSRGVDILLHKKIPSQAGLGGGSSNAATALLWGNRAWSLNLSREELIRIGSEIGSDVPLFLVGVLGDVVGGGASLSTGRGEIVETIPRAKQICGVIFKPRESLSTRDVYQLCMKNHDRNVRYPQELIHAWQSGNLPALAAQLFNRLEIPARELCPQLAEYRKLLIKHGAIVAIMSGSGTAIFGLANDAQHAQQIAEKLAACNQGMVFPFTTSD